MSDTKLTRHDYYPLAEGWSRNPNVMAQWNGEYRAPKAGEWYLSGAIIEAYQAKADMTTAYHIATLYQVKKETVITITKISEVKGD